MIDFIQRRQPFLCGRMRTRRSAPAPPQGAMADFARHDGRAMEQETKPIKKSCTGSELVVWGAWERT